MQTRPSSDAASRPLWLLTVALALLAAVAALLLSAQLGGQHSLPALALVTLGAVATRVALERWGLLESTGLGEAVLLGGFLLAFAPLAWGPASGAAPVFLLLMAGLRNVALVAAVLGGRPRVLRASAVAAAVVVLVSYSLGAGWALLVTALLFAGAGAAWLAMACWREYAVHLPRPPEAAPWPWAASLAALGAAAFLGGALLVPPSAQGLLANFLNPADQDQADGPAMNVPAQVVSANQQALDRLAEQQYGATAEELGAGPAAGAPGPAEGKAAEASRQFSLARAPRAEGEGDGRALFYVAEQGAGHVPVATYDLFDGKAWREEPGSGQRRQLAVELAEGRSWVAQNEPLGFSLDEGEGGGLARLARGLQGGRVLSLRRAPLDRRMVERLLARGAGNSHPDYRLTPEELLRLRGMAEGAKGEGLVALARSVLREREGGAAPGLDPAVRALLESWVRGQPRGWKQIDALVRGLRAHAVHDPKAKAWLGEGGPVRHFLLKSKRGPDYLFATSAVVLLRHLDYPSRLVGGFYVRPGEYRVLSGGTPVRAGDFHYWAQVLVPGGRWVNIEPTPGYEPTRPAYTLAEQAGHAASSGWGLARLYWPAALGAVLVLLVLWVARHRLAERLATAWWWLAPGGSARQLVRATWRLVERRAGMAGVARRPGVTLLAWSRAVASSGTQRPLAALVEATDCLTHAPAEAGPPEEAVRGLCREVVRICTVGALRHARGG